MSRADEAYRIIASHYDEVGYGMSYRELGCHLGCGLNAVYRIVAELEEDGRIMPRSYYSKRALVPHGIYATINGERFIGEAI